MNTLTGLVLLAVGASCGAAGLTLLRGAAGRAEGVVAFAILTFGAAACAVALSLLV